MKETDLYLPVKTLFEKEGYSVRGEVKDTDVIAVKGNNLIIVELKTTLNVKLLVQAVKRQRMTGLVYVAIPRPTYKKKFRKGFKDKELLIKRLGLGLILVAVDVKKPYASVVFEPEEFDLAKSRAASSGKIASLLEEYTGRSADYNTGGSVKEKLVTAYREQALLIAYNLKGKEKMRTGELREAGCTEKTTSILYNNHYGWFDKTGRGEYRLSKKGKKALKDYGEIIKHII